MDNNNQQSLETPQQSPVEPTPSVSKNLSRRVIVAIVLVLIIGGVIGSQFYRPHSEQLSNDSLQNTSVTELEYKSNTANIRFVIPEGWTINSNPNLSLPAGFKDAVFILQKTGSACTVVQASRDSATLDTRKQISFADRIFSNYTQFDGNWFLTSSSDSAQYSFSNHERQYLSGEFRVSTNLRNDPFILFMSDSTSVPDNCNNDFNALLATVEPYYETVRLASSSIGILTAEKVWDNVTSRDSNKSYEHLVFTADGSKEKREVMKIPSGTWTGKFSVLGGKLYIPSSSYQFNEAEKRSQFDFALYALDPFTGQTTQIPGTSKIDMYISSLYVRDGIAYYLANSSVLATCLDGYRPCASDLYSISLTGGSPTLIAHSSLGGSILGYVENEGAFYIRQGWGDAGCTSTSINKIVNGKEEVVGKFGECVGEDEASNLAYKQMQEKISIITMQAGASKLSSKGVRIQNGTLLPASGEISGNAIFYFDK
jgi:hypothetical protein